MVAENVGEDATNMLAWSPSHRELAVAQRTRRVDDQYDMQMLEVSTAELEKITPRMTFKFSADQEAQALPEQPFDLTFEDVVNPEQQRVRGVLDLMGRSQTVMSYGMARRMLLGSAASAEDLANADDLLRGALGPDGKPDPEKTRALMTAAMMTSLGSLANRGFLPEGPALSRLRQYREHVVGSRIAAMNADHRRFGTQSRFRGLPAARRSRAKGPFRQPPQSPPDEETSPQQDDPQQ